MAGKRCQCSGNLLSFVFLLLLPLGFLMGCLSFKAGKFSFGFFLALFPPGIEVIEDADTDGEGK